MNLFLAFLLLTLEVLLSLNALVTRPNLLAWPVVRAITGLLFLVLSLRSIATRRSHRERSSRAA